MHRSRIVTSDADALNLTASARATKASLRSTRPL
jgi:hypothetical protein